MEHSTDSILLLGEAGDFLREITTKSHYPMTVADDGEAWCSGKPGPRVNAQVDLEMALRSVMRMDPDAIFASSSFTPPELVPAIILTGHRLVYWWKGGDKDKALLRWHDWKFEKVLEIVGDEVRTLADISNVQPSEELPPESPEPYQIAITPQGFKALKEAVGSYAKPSFRPHAVSQRRESFIDRSGSPLLQLAASELPDGSPLVFPQGTAYLRLYWSEESGEGSVRFMPTHKEAGADTVFLGDWESVPSVPHYDDDQIDIAPQLLEAWPDLEVAALQPWSGEQLGGWPFWAQGAHTLNCPECGEPMRFRFQLSSEAEALIPSLFAAEGTGQIFQCECHPERLAWIWAC